MVEFKESNDPIYYVTRAYAALADSKPLCAWIYGVDKYQIAAHNFNKAAILYKRQQLFRSSADTRLKEARMLLLTISDTKFKQSNIMDAYVDAGQSYVRIHLYKKAISAYKLAMEYCKSNISMCFELQGHIANLYEIECNYEQAILAYEHQIEYFGNYLPIQLNPLKKIAEIHVLTNAYDRAIAIYEHLAQTAEQQKQYIHHVNNYLLLAGMCYMVSKNYVGYQNAIAMYQQSQHPFVLAFTISKEYGLLHGISNLLNPNNVDTIDEKLSMYDKLCYINENIIKSNDMLGMLFEKFKSII